MTWRNLYITSAAVAALVLLGVGVHFVVDGSRVVKDGMEKFNSADIEDAADAVIRTASSSPSISLIFGGDIMLSRGVGVQMRKSGNAAFPFLKIADTIRSADIAAGNLEGPISDRGANQGSIYSFRADPSVVEGLRFAGFDVLFLANNHIWDWGGDALTDTVGILRQNGIQTAGAGISQEEANAPVIKTVQNTRFAFFSFTDRYPKSLEAVGGQPGISHFDLPSILEKIRTAKIRNDIVIVSLHWGEEYATHAGVQQQEWAHAMIDAGANLVVGHHPHVTQELEQYRNGWIAYSLGNFVFDQNFSAETRSAYLLRVSVVDKRIRVVQKIPIYISDQYQPGITEGR